MNKVNITDVTLSTLAMTALAGAIEQLSQKDLITGASLFVGGVILVILYHRYGS